MRVFSSILIIWCCLLCSFAYAQDADTSIASTNLRFLRLGISVDPAHPYLSGSAQLHFDVENDFSHSPIELMLSNDYIISSISSGGHTLYYYRHNGNIRIYPVQQWSTHDSVTISYYGIPPRTGLGSVVFDTHENSPVFWTLSEPYGAMDWWPCKQDIADKIDSVDIIVRCPQKYRSASNGVIFSDSVKDGMRVTEWRHRYPIAYYLIGVAVSNYRTYSEWLRTPGGDSLEIVNYVYPERYDQWRRKTYRLLPVFRMLCDSFGGYPFAGEKYGQAQFGWRGGIEHQTMTFLHAPNLDLMIHELAHQWFGNMITTNNWHDIFLHEAFATYCEMLATEKGLAQSGDPVQWRVTCSNKALRKANGNIYRKNISSHSSIFETDVVYYKGAMMLHMLRKEIGDHMFFSCLKSFLSNPLTRYGNTSAESFFETVQKITGRKLDWFFSQWFYGSGIPKYNITWQQTSDGLVDLLIHQENTDSTAPFFRGKIPIMLHGVQGELTLFILNNNYNHQHFTINPKFAVEKVVLDPYCDILKAPSEVRNTKNSGSNGIEIHSGISSIRISLPDSCQYNWCVMRSARTQGLLYTQQISGEHKIEIHTSAMDEGQYILILEGKDYYSTIVNVWKRKSRKSRKTS